MTAVVAGAALTDRNRDVRRSAATGLGKLGDPRAADALSAALTDEWWRVGESARAALRKLKAAPSTEVLLGQLRHPNRNVRLAAIEAARAIRSRHGLAS